MGKGQQAESPLSLDQSVRVVGRVAVGGARQAAVGGGGYQGGMTPGGSSPGRRDLGQFLEMPGKYACFKRLENYLRKTL